MIAWNVIGGGFWNANCWPGVCYTSRLPSPKSRRSFVFTPIGSSHVSCCMIFFVFSVIRCILASSSVRGEKRSTDYLDLPTQLYLK